MLNKLSQQKRKPKKPTKKRFKLTDGSNKKTILDYFNTNNKQEQETKAPTYNCASLLKDYEYLTDDTKRKSKMTIIKWCDNCKIEKTLIQTEGIYVCQNCGDVETVMVENDIINYKEGTNEKPTYPYKRMNHLVECLNQLQAKESTEIPQEVYDKIIAELKKNKTKNNVITIRRIRGILKDLRLNQYYEHIPHIFSKLTHKPAPSLGRENEEKIKNMFRMIQAPVS